MFQKDGIDISFGFLMAVFIDIYVEYLIMFYIFIMKHCLFIECISNTAVNKIKMFI